MKDKFASVVIKSKYWDLKIQPIFHQIDPTDVFQKCQLAALSVVWALPSSSVINVGLI